MKIQKFCYICKEKFENKYFKDKEHHKVRDHCHYAGAYIGAAHSICNLKYSVSKIIPIVFHNGSNYYYHFIIKELAEEFKKQFTCLGENTERNFNEKLKDRFYNACKFSNHDNSKFNLLFRKDVYPYEYMDDWERFNEASLPKKEDFYSHLNMEDITDVDYAYAKKFCKDFEIKNLGEYHDLYVQSDTLLLVDVFEKFRNMCLEIYELNLAEFLSATGLIWQAALKKTK